MQTEFLIGTLGSASKLAEVLGVSKSQPSRWKDGIELPGPEMASQIVDLAAVVRKALLLWDSSLIPGWLESPSVYLGGARPIELVALRRSSEVLDALDNQLSGGYA